MCAHARWVAARVCPSFVLWGLLRLSSVLNILFPPPFFFILFLSVFAMGAYRAAFTGRRNLGSYFRGLFFFHFFPVRGKWAARDSPSFCVEWRAITPFSVSPRPIELIRGEKPRRSRNCFSDFEIITKCENLRGAAES